MLSHPALYGQLNSSGDTATYNEGSTYYLEYGGNVWAAGLGLMNGIGPYNEAVIILTASTIRRALPKRILPNPSITR